MSEQKKRRSKSGLKSRRSPASALELHHRIASLEGGNQGEKAGSDSSKLPPQEHHFLRGMPGRHELYSPQEDATKDLQRIIERHFYTTNFENAITAVSKDRIPELSRIQTLSQFYFYVDKLVTWIPEIRVWEMDGEVVHERTVYNRIVQFYYYFNQDDLVALQSPIAPDDDERLSPVSRWLRSFAVEWGAFLDKPRSAKFLESFKYAPEYTWQDYEKPPEKYKTFNEYFARQFKDIDKLRPVAQPADDRVVVFPAESTYVGQWAVTTPVGDPLPAPSSIVVKHIEWPIEELLADSKHQGAFEGGILAHSFLNTYDYHRQHTPVAGRILEAKFIPGQVYLQVQIDKQFGPNSQDATASDAVANAVVPNRYLDADDATGYQFVQCRGLMVLESAIGKVAILPMGMAQVSSVVFVGPKSEGSKPILLSAEEKKGRSYHEQVALLNEKLEKELVGKWHDKGDMMSYFQFGGSDCVVVFERKANVNITAQVNVHYPIRSQYAYANIAELVKVKK